MKRLATATERLKRSWSRVTSAEFLDDFPDDDHFPTVPNK
jgi:hypothetical protein